MRTPLSLPLLLGAVLLASPALRAEEVHLGTWTFNTKKKVSIAMMGPAGGEKEDGLGNQGVIRLNKDSDKWVLVNEVQHDLGKGSGMGVVAKTSMSLPAGGRLTLTGIFKDGVQELDQVVQIQVGGYSPFKVWVHGKAGGDPVAVELGDGRTKGTPMAKVRITGGDLSYTD